MKRICLSGIAAIEAFEARQADLAEIIGEAKPLVLYTPAPDEDGLALIKYILRSPEMQKLPASEHYMLQEMTLYPKIPGQEYHLNVPGRGGICRFKELGTYRDLPLIELMRPIKIPLQIGAGDAKTSVSLINPEILLIDIYRRIYTSSVGGPYEDIDLVKLEKRLFDRFLGDYNAGHLTGGEEELKAASPIFTSLRQELCEALEVHDDATNSSAPLVSIIVGKQALDPDPGLTFMQVLTSLDNNVIRERLDGVVKSWLDSPALAQFKGLMTYDISKSYQSLPVDPNCNRFRVFIQVVDRAGQKRKLNMIDVFNSGNYDIQCKHPYTYLRFLMTDIWSLILIRGLGEIDDRAADKQIDRCVGLAKIAHGMLAKAQSITDHSEAAMRNYFGYYIEEGAAARRDLKNAKKDYSSTVYAALLDVKGAH